MANKELGIHNKFVAIFSDQCKLLTVPNKNFITTSSLLKTIFLPKGYPDSVSDDYTRYQIWDTLQAFCSTITGILATQEVLRGVGVGDEKATALAATVTWVLKDGCGHIGKILFASSKGIYLDAYSKKWRLYADLLNDLAICLELSLPYFSETLFVLCFTTILKSIVGVAGGSTRAALTYHFALRNNLADIAAKEAAQETAVNLFASLIALMILTLHCNTSIFLTLIVMHLFFNIMAVKSVCLSTLNEPRYLNIIYRYIITDTVRNKKLVNCEEPVFFNGDFTVKDDLLCGFSIKVGCTISCYVRCRSSYETMMVLINLYKNEMYMLVPDIEDNVMYVCLKKDATTEHILKAYFHAVTLSIAINSLNGNYLRILAENPDINYMKKICDQLGQSGWSLDEHSCKTCSTMCNKTNTSNYEKCSTVKIVKKINTLLNEHWPKLREKMLEQGWKIDQHLIMCDEWRIASALPQPQLIQCEISKEL